MPSLTIVHMPEATVHKYDSAVLAQHDIRLTREISYILAVPKPLFEQILPHYFLRLCSGTSDMRHIAATLFWRLCVGHCTQTNLQSGSCYFPAIIGTVSRKFNVRNPQLCAVPSLGCIAGNLIHRKYSLLWIIIAQFPISRR